MSPQMGLAVPPIFQLFFLFFSSLLLQTPKHLISLPALGGKFFFFFFYLFVVTKPENPCFARASRLGLEVKCLLKVLLFCFFVLFGHHTASAPITSGTHTDEGAVIGKPRSARLED